MNNTTIKKTTGLVAIFTPLIIILAGFISPFKNNENWWHSLSASYYNQSTVGAFICCFIVLSLLLIFNKEILSKIVGVLLTLVLVFPCMDKTIPVLKDCTGLLKIPSNISDNIHSIISLLALIFMISEVIYFLCKYQNKTIYIVSLILVLIATVIIVIENIYHNNGDWSLHWTTIFTESTLFISFGSCFYCSGLEDERKLLISSSS